MKKNGEGGLKRVGGLKHFTQKGGLFERGGLIEDLTVLLVSLKILCYITFKLSTVSPDSSSLHVADDCGRLVQLSLPVSGIAAWPLLTETSDSVDLSCCKRNIKLILSLAQYTVFFWFLMSGKTFTINY